MPEPTAASFPPNIRSEALDAAKRGMAPPAQFFRRMFVATLGLALLLLLSLEFRSPYYFLQDDGLEYFLPSYLHNWRSLLSGHIPLYDFHIFAGIPHLAMGQTAVFYVPQYIAMFLSQLIWGHAFAAIDLLAIMHGLIAVAGGYVLLEYLGATEAAAAFGALTALSGFFVWAGRMWPFVPLLCAWFPWMVWASLRYLDKPSVGRAGWLMFFRLGLLYGGYPQYFVLAMLFEHLFVFSRSLTERQSGWLARYARYVALDVPTALLGLPFLLPVWAEAGRSLERSNPLSYPEFSALSMSPVEWAFGQLLVFIQLHLPKDHIRSSIPYLSYVGYLSSLLSGGAAVTWKKRPQSRCWIVGSCVCFLLAFLWSTNLLGPLIFHVPLLNRFRWPFKVIFFAGFFQCLVAALALTLFSKRWQYIAFAGLIFNWIAVFCFLPDHAPHVITYQLPLKSPWGESVRDGRYLVISRDPTLSGSKAFLERDYSALWGLDNLIGYEPLVPRLNATLLAGRRLTSLELLGGYYNDEVDQPFLEHLKKWSVKYVLVDPARSFISGKLAGAGFQVQTVNQGWTLWKDPDALPRIRWGDAPPGTAPDAGIRWIQHVNSIDADLSQWAGRQLVFAFAANQGLETCIQKRCTPVSESADGLIRLDVEPGTRHIRLAYHSTLLLPSILAAIATFAVYLLLLFRSRSRIRANFAR